MLGPLVRVAIGGRGQERVERGAVIGSPEDLAAAVAAAQADAAREGAAVAKPVTCFARELVHRSPPWNSAG